MSRGRKFAVSVLLLVVASSQLDAVAEDKVLEIPVGTFIGDMVSSLDSKYLFASVPNKSNIYVLDTYSNQVIKYIYIPEGYPREMDISANGTWIYVISANGSKVAVISTVSLSVIKTFNTTTLGYDIAYSKRDRLYISNLGKPGNIYIYNATTGIYVNKISAGGPINPARLQIHENILYAGETEKSPARIMKYDISTDNPTVIKELTNAGDFLGEISVSPDGSKIYVASKSPDYVQIYTNNFVSIGKLNTGDQPCNVVITPNGTWACVLDGTTEFAVFNTTTFQKVLYGNLPKPGEDLCILADGSKLYVSTSEKIYYTVFIPEFSMFFVPLIGTILLFLFFRFRSKFKLGYRHNKK